MKHNWIKYMGMFLLPAVVLIACREEDEPFTKHPVPDWAVDMVATPALQRPDWQLNLAGQDAAPSWQPVSDGTLQYSMTAVVRLTDFLESYVADGDLMAAFVGNECRALASTEELGGHRQYRFFIKGNNGEPPVSLRYYSTANKRLYMLADVCGFEQNGEYGTPSTPVVAAFEQNTPYAEGMTAVVTLPDMLAGEATDDDLVAAFCGTDCRGVGEAVSLSDGRAAYRLSIRGRQAAGDEITLHYYCARQERVYIATDRIAFAAGGTFGTDEKPEQLPVGAEGKYALTMDACVALPQHLTPYDAEGDLLAAFVGEECRGVGERTADGVYHIAIIGSADEAQDVHFRYYNRRNAYLYRTDVLLRFEADKDYGTPEAPVVLNLHNVQ